jgi:hypothetical protein
MFFTVFYEPVTDCDCDSLEICCEGLVSSALEGSADGWDGTELGYDGPKSGQTCTETGWESVETGRMGPETS